MSNIGSYKSRINDFKWSDVEKEISYSDGKSKNIGWYCSDRICQLGKLLLYMKISKEKNIHTPSMMYGLSVTV